MTKVAIHSAPARPVAVPLEQFRQSLSRSWERTARFEAAAGHHLLAEADAKIAADFAAGRSDPPLWQPTVHSETALRYYA